MKIPALDTVPTYTVGATPQSEFDIPFPFWHADDIVVIVGPLLEVLDPSEYTVAGIMEQDGDDIVGAYGSGTLTLDDAVTDTTVTVERLIVAERLTDFSNAAPMPPNTLNSELDKATARDQDMLRRLIQALDDLETVRTILAELELARLDALEDITDATATAVDTVEAAVQASIQANLNYHDRTLALNEAATDAGAQLTFGRMDRWDRTFRALEDVGFFAWGMGGLMVGESKAQTLLNFVEPELLMTEAGGTLRFLANRYVAGSDPAAAYIDSGYVILSETGFLQDSATLWVRPVEDIGDDERVIGTSGGKSFIAPTTDQNHVRLRLNSLANIDSTRFTPNGAGDWAVIRTDASTINLYRGDDLYETFTDTSQAISVGSRILILGAGAQRTVGKIAYAVWGLEATQAQYTAARAVLEDHAREIGAVP